MAIKLEPVRSSKIKTPQPYAVCDIESMKWIIFLLIGHFDGEHFWYYTDMNEYLDMVRDTRQKIIYAHFGGKFDFMFLFQWMVARDDITIEKMIQRGSGFLCFTAVFHDKDGAEVHRCDFRDSSALLPFGLKSLCESFKVDHPKLDWDHRKTKGVTNKLITYLQHDCEGLYEVIEKYQNWPLIQKSGSAYTLAGQAIKVFKTFLKDPINSLSFRTDKFVRRSYFGGRTEIFKPLFIGGKGQKLYCYDVNSLYPFPMRDKEFPTNFKKMTTNYDPNCFGFFEAKVRVPKNMHIPPLPTMQLVGYGRVWTPEQLAKSDVKMSGISEKLIFPTGTFTGVWSTIELEYARSIGVEIIETYEGAVFQNGGYIFKEYIDTLFAMRRKAQEEGDGVGDILCKLLMNALYGRFGLCRERNNLVFDDGQPGVKYHSEMTLANGKLIRIMTEKTTLSKSFSNVAISAWVTSHARIHMHKIFMDDPENIYYTDTDSLFTTTPMKTGTALGELKEEYVAKQACFLLPKTYFVKASKKIFSKYDEDLQKWSKKSSMKKITMKGFDRKKIGNFKFEDYFTALEGEMKQLKVVHDAKFATFKSAIKKNTFLTMLPSSPRQIRSKYDKRKVYKKGGDFYSRPHHISQ